MMYSHEEGQRIAKAIIYGRVSTSRQSGESIETQIELCTKWAKENGCIVVDIYDDSGQSGRAYNAKNRDGFQQIVEDARKGRMQYALIHKIDRFARSVADYFIQERALEEYGVKLIVVGMPFLQNADIVTKSVHIAMAEQFSVNLSNEVSEKMRTFAKKAAYLGGKIPYGFKRVKEGESVTLKIDEEQAQGVRLAYQMYLSGYGYVKTAQILGEYGYTNADGKPFTHTHIMYMLRNKKYNGFYTFGQTEIINGKPVKVADKNKVIEIPDIYEKIIDDKTFNAVQARISSKQARNKRKSQSRHYALTGRIICGECGRAYVGNTAHSKKYNIDYNYYRCQGANFFGLPCRSLRAEQIEDFVLSEIKKQLFNDDFSERLISEIEQALSGDVSDFKSKKKAIEKELSEVISQIKEATKDKYSKKIDDDIYNQIVEELGEQRQALELRLSNVAQQLNVEDKAADIRNYIKWLKDNLEKADDDIKGAFLQQAVNTIVVTDEGIEIFLYISTPPPLPPSRRAVVLDNITNATPFLTIDKYKVLLLESLNLISLTVAK